MEMNLAWNLTERESLILHYDSVKELGGAGGGGLACFQCFFFTLISGQSRVEGVAFTLFLSEKSQNAITRFKGFGPS